LNTTKNIKVSEQEMSLQKEFIEKIKERNSNTQKKYMVETFGCQMSENDAQKISGMLERMGYEPTDDVEQADAIIFNTCCVREHAEKKIFSRLGLLKNVKEKNKDLIIAFGGCMAQEPHVVEKIKKSYRYVDIIFGTHNIHRFPELMFDAIQDHNKIVHEVWDIEGVVAEGLPAVRNDGLKAWVSIMYGCNNFCSYCIVPYVRGRERSRDAADIISEIEGLAKEGYKEVTLLGQNVNSYGLDKQDGITFPQLLHKINDISGIERIRFMTSHPKDFSDELIAAIAECDKVCEHIHLPVQSGSSRILEKMNRKYTKEDYLKLIEKIKSVIPDVSLSTDIIVGFPGETEEDFNETLDVIQKVRYDSVYTFIFSKRRGTPADRMTDQIDEGVKKERFDRLLNAVQEAAEKNNIATVGNVEEILVEGASKTNENILTGRTRTNKVVNFEGDKSLIGQFVIVEIVSQHKWYFSGKIM
jgi:tRNA-2-methylthio-N6-dimethylallyladenosine synthase